MAPTITIRTRPLPSARSSPALKQLLGTTLVATKASRRARAGPTAKAKSARGVSVASSKASSKAAVKADFEPAEARTEPHPTLDHHSYPHIFETIIQRVLEQGCRATLLALRGVCTSLREAADLRLGSHLVLRVGLPPPKGAKWNQTAGYLPRGPAKTRPRTSRVNISSPHGRLPGLSCDYLHVTGQSDSCGEDCSALRDRWEAVFATTTVLDHHPWTSEHIWRLKSKFPALKVVRKYPVSSAMLDISAETMVVFTTLDNPESTLWATINPAHMCPVPRDVQKLVIHTTFNCARPTLSSCWVSLPAIYHVMEIVLIFEPSPGTDVYTNPEWEGLPKRPRGFLSDVYNLHRAGCISRYFKPQTMRFLIVGAMELPPRCLGIDDGIERGAEELETAVVEGGLQWLRDDDAVQRNGGLTAEREAEIRAAMRFVSVDGYRREVGQRQWELESVRTQPWGGS